MNCPVCKNIGLTPVELENNLIAYNCPQCGGDWVRDSQYKEWRAKHGVDLPEKHVSERETIQMTDVELARLCPDCRRILIKYKVGRDINFTLDRCGGCGGVWLDKDEWTTLKERNLHDNLYEFFTEPWQSVVRREEESKNMELIYKSKFGEEDYERVKDFKHWLDKHGLKNEILAFVNDPNPFDA